MKVTSKLDRLFAVVGVALVAATFVVLGVSATDNGASGAAAAGPVRSGAEKIVISDFKFMPADISVKAGTKVTFVNQDQAPHTATSDDTKTFDTNSLHKGDEKTVTLSTPGTYTYFCSFHPFMKGTLKVVGQ